MQTAQKQYAQKNLSYEPADDLNVSPSSQLINIILKSFLIPGKNYVKDNLDFLRNALEKLATQLHLLRLM